MQRRAFLKSIIAGAAVAVVPDLAVQDRAELARIGLLHPGRTVIDMHVAHSVAEEFWQAVARMMQGMGEAQRAFDALASYSRPTLTFNGFRELPLPIVNVCSLDTNTVHLLPS